MLVAPEEAERDESEEELIMLLEKVLKECVEGLKVEGSLIYNLADKALTNKFGAYRFLQASVFVYM